MALAKTHIFTLETLIMADKQFFTSPESVLDMLRLVDWVSGETNCLHQIPRALEQIGPFLRKQRCMAFLADVPDPDGIESPYQWNRFLDEQIARFGSSHDVPQMPNGIYDNWDAQHAEQEMAEMDALAEAKAATGNQIQVPGGPVISVDHDFSKLLGGGHVTIADLFGPDSL